jgi:ATP-dependent exoDNAse (exonuclease V) beta subunit
MHAKMQRIVIDSEQGDFGDEHIINTIKSKPKLARFFVPSAKTEVPIAGTIHGCFVSRRIDRLLINNDTKTIDFIDYKTDTDKNIFIDQYKSQLKEYAELLHSVYSDYKINGYILWLHDWELDKII